MYVCMIHGLAITVAFPLETNSILLSRFVSADSECIQLDSTMHENGATKCDF